MDKPFTILPDAPAMPGAKASPFYVQKEKKGEQKSLDQLFRNDFSNHEIYNLIGTKVHLFLNISQLIRSISIDAEKRKKKRNVAHKCRKHFSRI